jgi:hypothetical protein
MMGKVKPTPTLDGASFTVIPKKLFPPSSRSVRVFGRSKDSVMVHPALKEAEPDQIDLPQLPITLHYTCKVRRLLYMAEFLILLKYVEVVIPLVFSKWLYIASLLLANS